MINTCTLVKKTVIILHGRIKGSAETNSTIFEYSIVTVPFECHSTHMNIRVLRNRPSRDIPRVSIDKYGE